MKRKIQNFHPGEILAEEFLKPMPCRLAKETRMPATRVSEIIDEKRGKDLDRMPHSSRALA